MFIQGFSFLYKGRKCPFCILTDIFTGNGQYHVYSINSTIMFSYVGDNSAFGGPLKTLLPPSQSLAMDFMEESLQHSNMLPITLEYTKEIKSDYEKNLMMNLSKIEACGLLEDGWYLEGSQRIDKNVINFAKNVISSFRIQPEIFPNPNGTIQLEWEKYYDRGKEDSFYLEIEITPNNLLHIYQIIHDEEKEWDEEWGEDRIREVYGEVEKYWEM